MKKIEIMGCGYIGLPTAITFTLAGYQTPKYIFQKFY